MANCLYLHESYITKFDFMNYAFAKLVVAWLLYVKASVGFIGFTCDFVGFKMSQFVSYFMSDVEGNY